MWRFVNVSVKGTSHLANEIPCQDHNACRVVHKNKSKTLILCVSDGAGSALLAEQGSAYICDKFIRNVAKSLKSGRIVGDFDKEFFKEWLLEFQSELLEISKEGGKGIKDFACTFLGAIVGESHACFVQIGDGAIVFKDEDERYDFVFMPQQGQFVNQTFFATDENATAVLEHQNFERRIDEIALFTDGLQNLVLDLGTSKTNRDFFDQWFSWLSETPNGDSRKRALETYLQSPKINERTDDDKTLVLAVRDPLEQKKLDSAKETII